MDVSGFALVTGSASGIGRACAKSFAVEGAAGVALFDLNKDALADVKAEIEALCKEKGLHPQLETWAVDVSDEQQITNAVEEVVAKFGRLDYAVNAAGIAMKHIGGAAFAKTEDWNHMIDVNLNGCFYLLRAAARIMLKQDRILSSVDGRALQRGSIVNFGSIQAVVGIELSTAYAAAKHAVLGLTRTASEDYAKDGLRINAVCPGYTETPLTTKNPQILKAMQERVDTAVPMKRMGQPSEIADAVLYLAGGRSSFVTGSALMVDGGYTSR